MVEHRVRIIGRYAFLAALAAAFALSRMAGRGRQPVAAESDATTSPS